MPSADVNGVTIEYDVRGEGEPVLFVMGLGGQLIDWPAEFVDLFVARGFQTIRFDNRDVGLSSRTRWEPPGRLRTLWSLIARRPLKKVGYTLSDMAADAAGLLDHLGIGSAHVVGLSMGGMIVQEMSIDHPHKVRSLCSIMSNTGDRRNGSISLSLLRDVGRLGEPTRDNAVDYAVEMFEAISGPHFDEQRFRELAEVQVARSFDPAGVARQSAAVAGSRDRTELLASVKVPALVIHGLLDPLVKPSGGEATAKAIPGSRLLAFGDMGHDLPRPRWPEIRDSIVASGQRTQAGLP